MLGGVVATKTEEARELDHPELTTAIGSLQAIRKAKKSVETMEDTASEEAKELMEEFGPGKFRAGDFKFSYLEGSRSSISKDLLLEAGVEPSMVERCTRRTKYRYIGEISDHQD